MADPIRFLLLSVDEAALVRGTTSLGHSLSPRTIIGGQHAGKAVLPLAVLVDPAHTEHQLFLLQLAQVNLDPEQAWPAEEEV